MLIVGRDARHVGKSSPEIRSIQRFEVLGGGRGFAQQSCQSLPNERRDEFV